MLHLPSAVSNYLNLLSVGQQRRPMKRFTPPRGYEGESSEYSDDEDYSDSDSYT